MVIQKNQVPYGNWKSPISSHLVASQTTPIGQVALDGADIYWSEFRSTDGGRSVVVRHLSTGECKVVTPGEFNVRTRVHEYGGGAYLVDDQTVFFSNDSDQQLYQQRPDEEPSAISHTKQARYADAVSDRARHRLICVCEDHAGPQPTNSLVAIYLGDESHRETLVCGSDFYASPRISPNGDCLVWLAWNHPNMPWDGTELWMAEFDTNGFPTNCECIAGGENESVLQPKWSPTGTLYFVSDRNGWWNLHRLDGDQVQEVYGMPAEFCGPAWLLAGSTYAFETESSLLCAYTSNGCGKLGRLNLLTGELLNIPTPFTTFRDIHAGPGFTVFVGGSPTSPTVVARLEGSTDEVTVLRRPNNCEFNAAYLSSPQDIRFPTEDGDVAHGFYYPPTHTDCQGPPTDVPPLLVKCHGGPTAAASLEFRLEIQFWTTRGFAVLDLNYRGSTGYGRSYREKLRGNWGVTDVIDCVDGANYLVAKGLADPERLAVTGGSAGGYTTLATVAFRDTFKVAASYFGISDLTFFSQETHKFESRYLDSLVGPYPECRQLYHDRSPINFVDRITCPIIFFQGDEDVVVPSNQSESMVNAIRHRGQPVAYLSFAGEQHGFRRSETIRRALDAELFFYSLIFGLSPADNLEPVIVNNM